MNSVGSRFIHLMIFWCWCTLRVGAENVEIVTPENTKVIPEAPRNETRDSYVKAYEEVQKLRTGPAKRNDYDPPEKDKGSYNTVIRSSYLSDDKYPSIAQHWEPMHAPAPPTETYGAPFSHSSQPPMETYGAPFSHSPQPPIDTHGAHYPQSHHSHHSHHYHEVGPPTHCHTIPYSSPSTSFFGFLPKKLSLKLLIKILLKLVLFKMIVKFIAVICLLLFIPLLKSKGTSAEVDDRTTRELDALSSFVWGGLDTKNALYGDDEEDEDMKDIKDIVGEDEDEEENVFSGPLKAVRLLEFCVSAVDRVVGYILSAIKRQRYDEGEDLGSFVLEKINNFVKSL